MRAGWFLRMGAPGALRVFCSQLEVGALGGGGGGLGCYGSLTTVPFGVYQRCFAGIRTFGPSRLFDAMTAIAFFFFFFYGNMIQPVCVKSRVPAIVACGLPLDCV